MTTTTTTNLQNVTGYLVHHLLINGYDAHSEPNGDIRVCVRGKVSDDWMNRFFVHLYTVERSTQLPVRFYEALALGDIILLCSDETIVIKWLARPTSIENGKQFHYLFVTIHFHPSTDYTRGNIASWIDPERLLKLKLVHLARSGSVVCRRRRIVYNNTYRLLDVPVVVASSIASAASAVVHYRFAQYGDCHATDGQECRAH